MFKPDLIVLMGREVLVLSLRDLVCEKLLRNSKILRLGEKTMVHADLLDGRAFFPMPHLTGAHLKNVKSKDRASCFCDKIKNALARIRESAGFPEPNLSICRKCKINHCK